MNHLQKIASQIRAHILGALILNNMLIIGIAWLCWQTFSIEPVFVATALGIVAIGSTVFWANYVTNVSLKPLRVLQQGILHASPNTVGTLAPDVEKLHIGHELVASLLASVYQLANVSEGTLKENELAKADLSLNFIANKLPLPLAVLDENQTIVFANDAAIAYAGAHASSEVIGKNAYTIFDMSFLSAFTLDAWLEAAKKSKPTAAQTWERVKLTVPDDDHTVRLFDLAAYYNQNNPNHFETILVFFDHTDQYSQDDQAMSFVALSVHELRTPLTLLRGYIEVLIDELGKTSDPELVGYMHKMEASAQQLTYFVNNILNVARIEQTGLELELHEEDWKSIVTTAVEDMSMRAQVRGISITTSISDGLPPVAADRVSIYEVVCNLLDNAIKYSGTAKEITVKSYLTKDGVVETTVEDKGVGIPQNSMRNLFDKFYRDHHKRDTIGGTGLGLYLSKIIVAAHTGHIWVKSKEGEGSTFGFTLMPYSALASQSKNSDNKGIVRSAHGWIKNHSIYRR